MEEENPFLRAEAKRGTNVPILILQIIAVSLTILVVLYVALINFNEVDGPSMEPNFYTDQALFTSRVHKWLDGTGIGNVLGLDLDRGDVVVFKNPEGSNQIVKRIIGLPGESIRIENGIFYVDGDAFYEDFNTIYDSVRDNKYLVDGGPEITLASDEFFLSGDNRAVSIDSRDFGPVKRDLIVGKVVFRISSPIGPIGTGSYELR